MQNNWLCFHFGDLAVFGVTTKFYSRHINDLLIFLLIHAEWRYYFFKLKDKLPDSTGTSVILRKEMEAANKEVTNVLQSATEKGARQCRKYNSYMPQRA